MRQIRIPNITAEQHVQAEKLFLFFRDYIEKHKTLLNYFEDLKSSILDKAFCGELVPQNPKDEPVERLLERIIQEKSKLKKKTKKLSSK
jgi:type I restriction enzyme S subunit